MPAHTVTAWLQNTRQPAPAPPESHTYAAVHWTTDEQQQTPYAEVLIVRAESREHATAAFNEHISRHGLKWRSYELQLHLGDNVLHLTLDPPEPDE